MDTEAFPNLWAIGFRDVETKKVVKLKLTDDEPLDRKRIATILRNYRVYTFNGINYDIPMILLAMTGATCDELKRANDLLIPPRGSGKGMAYWVFYEHFDVQPPAFLDHVDLMQVAPSAAQRAGLKKYAGMMHSRSMMESKHDFMQPLSQQGIQDTMDYLDNDLEVTCDLIEELTPQVDIRAYITTQIGVDVRSKSDAQTGEAIMRARVEKRMGNGAKLYKPDIVPGPFKYEAPAYVSFKTEFMQGIFDRLLRSNFVVKHDGYVQLPEMFGKSKKKEITDDDDDEMTGGSDIIIGGNVYKMGIGGLHSKEKAKSWFEDDEYELCDIDVTGYYPNLIIQSKREPDNMRGHYQVVYKGIVDERAAAKRAGDKAKAEQGKIASNGLFGKAGSPYSIVYAPRMLIQTTVTGQLSLLMLIEECELRGWKVISANTDGIVVRVPRKDRGMFKSVVFDWECVTGLNMEETNYRSIHSISVNSYVALKKEVDKKTGKFNGKIEAKRKGKFAPSGRGIPAAMGLKKAPELEIAYDAAVQFLLDGTPPESTVRNCQDIRKFVTVKAVAGGAEQNGEWIGKVVRFYYGVGNNEAIYYQTDGKKVSRSEGAVTCMVLPDELPGDIDYEFYEREAFAILHDTGMVVEDPTTRGRTGQYLGRLDDQKTVHTINASTGVALCGRARPNRRDPWIEYGTMPTSYKHCTKCAKESL